MPRVSSAARDAVHEATGPFVPGCTDASQDETDVASFAPLEPVAVGFRNDRKMRYGIGPELLLLDRAQLLTLTAPEMTVLVGGPRVPGANVDRSADGVFTKKVGTRTNAFFVKPLDVGTQWKTVGDAQERFAGVDCKTGEKKWTATRADLVFGSNAQMRAIAEVCASPDAQGKFVDDFVAVWTKAMNLDRYDG